MKLKWSTKFPKKEGNYWFYGYRYGKHWGVGQGASVNKPEWMVLTVRKCANGLLYMADGQFMFESEVEEAHFAPFELPEFPELKA